MKLLREGPLIGRYVLSGGTAALLDFGGFVMLSRNLDSVALAATLSFLCAMVFNFLVSARYVFRMPPSWRLFAAFAGFALSGMAINVGITTGAVLITDMPDWLAKLCGIGIAFVFNLCANRYIVFRT